MGRGILYSYDHFMLFNEEEFMMYPPKLDENGYETDEVDYNLGEWDEFAFEDFKATAAQCFNADMINEKYVSREAYYFAENDRLYIGVDFSGGSPCIFVEPKEYCVWNSSSTYKRYNITRDAVKGFNKLIKYYGTSFFRLPSSSWTSCSIQKYIA